MQGADPGFFVPLSKFSLGNSREGDDPPDVVELFTMLPTESIRNILWKKSNVCYAMSGLVSTRNKQLKHQQKAFLRF